MPKAPARCRRCSATYGGSKTGARPRVLLFDEATSALDNRTQAVVSASLGALQATRVVIAHRLSTIVGADSIYVFEAGRVVQRGAYRELVEVQGPFRELMRRQIA